jgi:hypoxanthine phosphoribosyltransferase
VASIAGITYASAHPSTGDQAVSESLPAVLISESDIRRRVEELAREISDDYRGKGEIVLVGVLKGAFIFLADLSRRLEIPRRIEFIAVSSYEDGSVSSGAVRLVMDVRGNIEDCHVLIVEDIVDTGHTLSYLIGMLESHRPASICTCALLHKADRSEVDVDIDYVGFGIGDEWVVGYGLDYAEQNRTLPYIGTIKPQDS